ncbi:hypothetical protein HG536_0F01600 [Torulaspora globosa]|uniref:NTR2 n=1 Tax=Torulaspora globosa TaxID=48254 RepID=A0A7G3ZJZ9_9SACH|nr:uncharacterized protein HG536_0F01600 [Torulaspora globosa]QLL33835.1 hypothetical protein HG536_0F01600 [Torulaspora globosa]
MNIRKRVKINVQSSAETGTIDAKRLNKVRLSLFRDDDDDDDLKDAPTRVLKKKRDQQPSEIAAPEESHISYNDLFSRKSASKPSFERVLNLEDMAEEDDSEPAAVACMEETELRHSRNQDDEKVYVSLLDKEDKLEIIDTMKRQGGPEEQDELDEHELELLDDGTLPLSSRELLLSRSRKKQAIEEAIRMQDEEGSATWETRMLSKGTGDSRHSAVIAALPRLYSSDSSDDDESDVVGLSQAIASIALRKRQLEKQLIALKAQKASLQQQQATLIHRLDQWPQI